MPENSGFETTEECICGFGYVVIVAEDNDHLCENCRDYREKHGWCMAEAADRRKMYGDNWTVAQANAERAPYRQPDRKHTRRKNGWW